GPRRERPESASNRILTQAQARGNEKSSAARGAKHDKEGAEDERTRIHLLCILRHALVKRNRMKRALVLVLLVLPVHAYAQQAPWGRPDIPVSSHDRVYAADQTSNTVSVIDPSNNKLLGVIRLGDPVPDALSPLYKGQLLVHGLGYSPDSKTLAVVAVGSNSVTLIDMATKQVKGTVYVGRSPHEAFFTPDGSELWVTVRGEDYVSVIDPLQMKETRRIAMANGPGMTIFGPGGKYA